MLEQMTRNWWVPLVRGNPHHHPALPRHQHERAGVHHRRNFLGGSAVVRIRPLECAPRPPGAVALLLPQGSAPHARHAGMRLGAVLANKPMAQIDHYAWEEGGFWVVDISDLHHPKSAAWFVPPVRSDSARRTGHADDVYLMGDGVCFGSSSDEQAGGLWAMRYRKGTYGKVKWNAEENGVITTPVARNDGAGIDCGSGCQRI